MNNKRLKSLDINVCLNINYEQKSNLMLCTINTSKKFPFTSPRESVCFHCPQMR